MREQIFRQFQAQKSTFTGGKLRFQRAENGGKDAAQRAAELCGVALMALRSTGVPFLPVHRYPERI